MGLSEIRGGIGAARPRDNAAVQHGAGDARQLFVSDHVVRTADSRHIGAELADQGTTRSS